jgi:hypothetical protein
MVWGIESRIILIILMSISSGCASGFRNVKITNELPVDLPKEMKEKFEIKDAALHSSSISPSGAQTNGKVTPVVADASLAISESGKSQKNKSKKNKENKVNRAEASAKSSSVATPAASNFVYPVRRPEKNPFLPGERLVFSINYFGMSAGDFTLEVLPYKVLSNRKVFHIRGTAISSAVFSIFYRLHDVIESYMDYDGEFSHRFHLKLDESKQTRDALELNDSEKSQTYYWNRWNHHKNGYKESKEFAPITPFSQDSLSSLYYIRTVPLKVGDVVTFPVVSEGKNWESVCTVLRKEEMSTPIGKIPAIVIRPEMKFQGVLKKSGDSSLWLSDDERRIPLRLEAKVKIGTVVANLKKVEFGQEPAANTPMTSPSPVVTALPNP